MSEEVSWTAHLLNLSSVLLLLAVVDHTIVKAIVASAEKVSSVRCSLC